LAEFQVFKQHVVVETLTEKKLADKTQLDKNSTE
jgi:hypothetical protein